MVANTEMMLKIGSKVNTKHHSTKQKKELDEPQKRVWIQQLGEDLNQTNKNCYFNIASVNSNKFFRLSYLAWFRQTVSIDWGGISFFTSFSCDVCIVHVDI